LILPYYRTNDAVYSDIVFNVNIGESEGKSPDVLSTVAHRQHVLITEKQHV